MGNREMTNKSVTMNDLKNASFISSILIHIDYSQDIVHYQSQKSYINKTVNKFDIKDNNYVGPQSLKRLFSLN